MERKDCSLKEDQCLLSGERFLILFSPSQISFVSKLIHTFSNDICLEEGDCLLDLHFAKWCNKGLIKCTVFPIVNEKRGHSLADSIK